MTFPRPLLSCRLKGLSSVGCILLVLLAFWGWRFDEIPGDYTEYSEVDLVAWCLAHKGVSAEGFYKDVYERSQQTAPRVPMASEINPLPLEMIARVAAKRIWPSSSPFDSFRLTLWPFLLLGTIWIALLLRRVIPQGWLACTLLFISSFPLITVGRVAGRLGPFLSAFLVAIALLYFHLYLIQRKRSDLWLAGLFVGLCLFNQLHSCVYILPCLLGYYILREISRVFSSRGIRQTFKLDSKAILAILGVAWFANAVLILFTRLWLPWKDPAFLFNLLGVGRYPSQFVQVQAVEEHRELGMVWHLLVWCWQSFFAGPYFYSVANHLEEFNVDYPIFPRIFSLLLLPGVIRAVWLLKRGKSGRGLGALAIALVAVNIASVCAYGKTVAPRYLLSCLLGYVLMAFLGLQMLQLWCRRLGIRRILRQGVMVAVVTGCLVSVGGMFYSGNYAKNRGNTLVRSAYVWAGNRLAAPFLLSAVPADRLNATPVLCGPEVNRAVLSFCTNFKKLDGFYPAYPALADRRSFSQFCLEHCTSSDAAIFLNYSFARVLLDYEKRETFFDYSPSSQENAMEALFTDAKPAFTSNYFESRDTAIRGYLFDLTWMSKNILQAPPVEPVKERNFPMELRQGESRMLPQWIRCHEGLAFFIEYSPTGDVSRTVLSVLKDGSRMGFRSLVIDFFTEKGIPIGTSKVAWGDLALVSVSGSNRRAGNAITRRMILAGEKIPQGAEYLSVRLENENPYGRTWTWSTMPTTKVLQFKVSRCDSDQNWLRGDPWLECSAGQDLFDLVEVPGREFRVPLPERISRDYPLIQRTAIHREVSGSVPPMQLSEEVLKQNPRFLILRMKVLKGDRFDFTCTLGTEEKRFRIPVVADGVSRVYVLDLAHQGNLFPKRPPAGDFKAEIEEILIYRDKVVER